MNWIRHWFYRRSLKKRGRKPLAVIKQVYPSLISQHVKPLSPAGLPGGMSYNLSQCLSPIEEKDNDL